MPELIESPEAGREAPVDQFRVTMESWLALQPRDIFCYRLCDELSGLLIAAMVVFSPWAFGTTQPWAIQAMNVAGYALGLLLLVKLFLRRAKGYLAPRWEHFSSRSGTLVRRQPPEVRRLKKVLAWLSLAVLAECLVSALNAAAHYSPATRVFHYRPFIEWLPHSFDADRTWAFFGKYLGLAGAFWATADWLTGLTSQEERRVINGDARPALTPALLPARLRWLLWLLAINGALLGLEGIIQRESGTDKLLFLLQPRLNQGCESQFGPYAYRSNAAQYFNLVWPLCLGLWWALHHAASERTRSHHLLLICAGIMAACPIISSSRAGALVSVAMLFLLLIYLGLSRARPKSPASPQFARVSRPGRTGLSNHANRDLSTPASLAESESRPEAPGIRSDNSPEGAPPKYPPGRDLAFFLIIFAVAVLALGWFFGWQALEPRLKVIGDGYENRQAMAAAAEPMTLDYPLYGTGPGTFASVFQLYRYSDKVYWSEQVYNDWLETRITFGWVGFLLILAALAVAILLSWLAVGLRGSRRLVAFAWVALGGCLTEAYFDIPFQIHSTLFLFLLICALLLNLGTASGSSRA